MRRWIALVVVSALALLAAGCGSRVDHEPRSTAAAWADDGQAAPVEAADDADVRREDPSPEAAVAAPVEPSEAAPQPAPAVEEPAPAGLQDGEFARGPRESELVTVAVEPACVRPGDAVSATITTDPGMHLTLVVSYADGNPHGQFAFAEAGADGSYVWRWVVTPTVPPGEALAYVAATRQDNGQRDWATDTFTVVAPTEDC